MKEFVWYLNIKSHSVVMCLILSLDKHAKTRGLTACLPGTILEILICNKFFTFLLLRLDSVFVVRFIRQLFVYSSYF